MSTRTQITMALSATYWRSTHDTNRMQRGTYRMAHVIIDTCVKDMLCVDCCPSDAIHPLKSEAGFESSPQLYINPELCADCGACAAECPTNSIFSHLELPPDKKDFAKKNYVHFLDDEE
jgi:ferredoxin